MAEVREAVYVVHEDAYRWLDTWDPIPGVQWDGNKLCCPTCDRVQPGRVVDAMFELKALIEEQRRDIA